MILSIVALVIVGVDQVTKVLVNAFFIAHPESVPMVQDVFHLTLVKNTGIAFGLMRGHSTILAILIGLCLVALIVYVVRHEERSRYHDISYGFIIGGALGNIIDRVRLGYVVDFLDFRIWPVFNLADTFISIGFGLLILEILLSKTQNKEPRN